MSFIKPARYLSRIVLEKDMARIREDAPVMHAACNKPYGIFSRGFAVAHSQVTDEDPLRFFVTRQGVIVVNPTIVRHTSVPVLKDEACLSFPHNQPIHVKRFYKCEVTFNCIEQGQITERRSKTIKGLEAQVWQHEIDHFNGIFIYDPSDFKDPLAGLSGGNYPRNPEASAGVGGDVNGVGEDAHDPRDSDAPGTHGHDTREQV